MTADDRGLHAAVGTLVCKKKIFFLVFSKCWKSQAKIENIFNTNLLCLQPNSFYVTEGFLKNFRVYKANYDVLNLQVTYQILLHRIVVYSFIQTF